MSISKKLAVAIDATAFVDGRAPGFNYYILSLLDGISKCMSVKIEVSLYVREDQLLSFVHYKTCMRVIPIKISNVMWRVLWQNIYLPLISSRYDMVIYPGNFAPFFSRSNYFLVVHDLNFLRYPENFSKFAYWFRRLNVKLSIRRSARCIAISQVVKREIFDYVGREVDVIYNAVRKPVAGTMVERVIKQEDKWLIIIPSSLSVHKNIAPAYEASIEIAKKYDDVSFAFFGSWLPANFLNTVKHDRVNILGYVTDQDKAYLFENCDAVLVPSVYEGFGIPYVEAMLLDKCLICSDISVAREVSEGYPYYIQDPYGAREIFCAIESALSSRFVRNPFDKSLLDRYSVSSVAQNYLNLIESEISKSK